MLLLVCLLPLLKIQVSLQSINMFTSALDYTFMMCCGALTTRAMMVGVVLFGQNARDVYTYLAFHMIQCSSICAWQTFHLQIGCSVGLQETAYAAATASVHGV